MAKKESVPRWRREKAGEYGLSLDHACTGCYVHIMKDKPTLLGKGWACSIDGILLADEDGQLNIYRTAKLAKVAVVKEVRAMFSEWDRQLKAIEN